MQIEVGPCSHDDPEGAKPCRRYPLEEPVVELARLATRTALLLAM